MSLLTFSILFLVLSIFGAAAIVVVYHLRRYAVPGDHSRLFLGVFLAGTAVFTALTILAFLGVPWDSFSVEIPYGL